MSTPTEPTTRSLMVEAMLELDAMSAKLEALERAQAEPIAIVGMACRVPGGVDNPEGFWRLLDTRTDGVTEVPPERWRWVDHLSAKEGDVPDRRGVRWGGFLKDVDRFDAPFFGISGREASTLDPQQRIVLEVVWEALEHAGIVPDALAGSRTGIYVGVITDDYKMLCRAADPKGHDLYAATGNGTSFPAGRTSYLLGLQGPAVGVDTACSSSLVAVHLACQSLRTRESNIALAGGVNLTLLPLMTNVVATTGVLAPDGRCKTFDAQANGFVRGEGCGVVVLKRLTDAQADGDNILAVIRGSAVNQDGRSTGLTAPNVLSQKALLRLALENARVAPSDVTYVETHGTGTPLGDPIEFEALADVFGAPRGDGSTCALGALKTNIGHLEGAAGVAGLIKVVLALQNEAIPANLHFKRKNPRISLDGTPLVIPTEKLPWTRGAKPRIAGVSAFGLSGTNAHVVVEEAPCPAAADAEHLESVATGDTSASEYVLPLSARSPEALAALAASYQRFLTEGAAGESVRDIAYTASVRRSHHDHRLAVVGRTREELADALRDAANVEKCAEGANGNDRRVVFVFSGQGSQWAGMGRELLRDEPVFREAVERCDALLRRHVSWSLIDEMTAPPERSRMLRPEIAQPALFAVQFGLSELWRSWGVRPAAVIGQSIGEVAAACVAGALSLEDAIFIVYHRGRLTQTAMGLGKMASVDASAEQANRALEGYEGKVAIASINDPGSVVLSGDGQALDEVLASLARSDVRGRVLKVDYASHSPQMDPLLDELASVLTAIKPKSANVPMVSTVTGAVVQTDQLDAAYWAKNLRETVHLAGALDVAITEGYRTFLEVGPHPVALASIRECLSHRGVHGVVVSSLRRESDERRVLLDSVAALYAEGHTVAWKNFFPSAGRCVSLPTYPWQRARYWVDTNVSTGGPEVQAGADRERARDRHLDIAGVHPLLGAHFSVPTQPGTHFWEKSSLSEKTVPYLADHRVQGAAVLPGAAVVELALAAHAQLRGDGAVAIENVTFERMLTLPAQGSQRLQVVVTDEGPGRSSMRVFSRLETNETLVSSGDWVRHATATLLSSADATRRSFVAMESPEVIQQRCPATMTGAELYRDLIARGLEYGPAFRGVEQLWFGGRDNVEALARVRLPDAVAGDPGYRLHPALLDACLQVVAPLFPVEGTLVPVGIASLVVPEGAFATGALSAAGATVWAHARVGEGELTADLSLIDEDGRLLVELTGFRVQRLAPDAAARTEGEEWLHAIDWQRKDIAPTRLRPKSTPRGAWLLFCDRSGTGDALAARIGERGDTCVRVVAGERYARLAPDLVQVAPARPEDMDALVRDVLGEAGATLRGVVHLFSLDAADARDTTADTLMADQELGSLSALSLAQALLSHGGRDTPRLWLVTRAAQAVASTHESSCAAAAVSQAPLWGLGRVLALEHPELACTRIDLSAARDLDEADILLRELESGDGEDQVALRPDGRYVARLARSTFEAADAAVALEPARGRPFRLEIAKPGILEHLRLRQIERRKPGPLEVEIEVESAGLNFRDVLFALGAIPDVEQDHDQAGSTPRLGAECAGRVVAVGEGVHDLELGQEVIAVPNAGMASFVIADSRLVVAKPRDLTFEQASTLPVAFLTAYYALAHVARLRPSERVLIHAGTGGVGLAAIQIAQRAGAEVFATAGSDEKREFLRSLGVEHVMDSRSLKFADDVMRITNGEGIDVVLNSLSGDFISTSLGLLRDHGRFIEIGKRDCYENTPLGLRPFLKNLSFSLVDIGGLAAQRIEVVSSLLHEMVRFVNEGVFRPLPVRSFPISSAVEAFTWMAQARHIGKVALRVDDPDARIDARPRGAGEALSADGSYLITGGLGGLGISLAQSMVQRGARHLALVGRSAPSERARAAIAAMEQAGARVLVVQADVAKRTDVALLLARVGAHLPRLRGIVHAAAVLEDHTIQKLNPELFWPAFTPKALGAWNLHELTLDTPLDFFVLYSGAASLVGSPGQANYAAGNAFLDALAHHRRALGLPALSINWGAFSEVGLAAAQENRGDRLAYRGVESLTPAQGEAMLAKLLNTNAVQIGVMPFDVRRWLEFHPTSARSPYWSSLLREQETAVKTASSADGRLLERLKSAEVDEREELMVAYLRDQVVRTLRVDRSRLERATPFGSVGMDSLMSLELKHRLESSLGIKLPASLLYTYPNVATLSEHLLERLALAPPKPDERTPPSGERASAAAVPESAVRALDALSEDEMEALIAEELAEIKQQRRFS